MWIELHQTLPRHPKLLRLASLLKIRPPEALGNLVTLWLWCLDYASDGDLSKFGDEEVAIAAGYWAVDTACFREALQKCGLLDADGKVHDWENYGGRLIAIRDKNAKRNREWRERITSRTTSDQPREQNDPSRDGHETITQPSRDSHVIRDRTGQDRTGQERGESAVGAPLVTNPEELPPEEPTPKKAARMESAKPALALMRELSGRSFRDVEANLLPIAARLTETGVSMEGVLTMLRREWECRKGNPDDERWFQPETVFRKKNFDGFYSARDLPPRSKAARDEPPWAKAKRLDDAIATHPGNPEWISFRRENVTEEMIADFRRLRTERTKIT